MRLRLLVSAAVVAILSACSGGALPSVAPGGPAAALAPPARATNKKVKIGVHVFIPRAPKHARGRKMRPFFIATTTQGVEIAVYAHGAHTSPLSTTLAGVAAGSSLCVPVTGGRSCIIPAAAPVGNDDFVATTYDAPPAGTPLSFTGAKQLAIGSDDAGTNIQSGKANQVNFSVGGVVASSFVTLVAYGTPVIDSETQAVTVSARDADNNTIIGGWFDANGTAVTMTLAASNTSPVVIGLTPKTGITSTANTSTLVYLPSQATSAQVQNGFASTITATPSNSATAGNAVLNFLAPTFTRYTLKSANSFPKGIIAGPDGAMWFAEECTNNLGRISVQAAVGSQPAEFSVAGSGTGGSVMAPGPVWLANGADGNLWFTNVNDGSIGRINVQTDAVTSYVTPYTKANMNATSSPWGIAAGPDGNLWFVEQTADMNNVNRIGEINPTTQVMNEFAVTDKGVTPTQIAAGSDGRLWFSEPNAGKVGAMTTAGAQTGDYAMPTTNVGDQGGLATDSTGVMWFAECNNPANKMARIPTSGTGIAEYDITSDPANPTGVVKGPDGAMWFAENAADKIGRIDPVTHVVDEFTIPGTGPHSPYGIALAPNGSLWFTECDGNTVDKLQ
jgi:virginiamycin B lyase